MMLSGVVFLASIAFYAGEFGYKLYLTKQTESLKESINLAGDQFQSKTLAELTRTDGKLVALSDIIAKHTTLLPLFSALDSYTLETVRFTNFSFAHSGDRAPTIELAGDAAGYASIALQSDSFSKSGSFKDIVFSDLNLDQNGRVTFSLTATVDPALLALTTKPVSDSAAPAPTTQKP